MRLEAHSVSFSYAKGDPVLRAVSLSVGPGEAVFLLGANGSGKTTLLGCLCGIRRPQDGRVLLGGVDVQALSRGKRARLLGLIPQVHEPVFSYTVEEVVLMGRAPHLGLVSSPGREDLRIAAEALWAVGLGQLWDRPYTTLSGGEQRLCLIARGLAQGAAFLLMDEPDAHLDPRNQDEVLGMVRGLAREGLSFLVTTHNPNNALLYAHRVLLLGLGELIAQGAPGEALTPPALSRAYGIPFEVIGDGQGPRALLPLRGSGA